MLVYAHEKSHFRPVDSFIPAKAIAAGAKPRPV
ncbi:hypothetical protein QFZ88_000100 [Mesorhizobium sp. YL-MeA3-2017]|jgi:hypothetical protein|nr:hypothetical protein [Mesorhizobium sp. YL-MeA3-2017]